MDREELIKAGKRALSVASAEQGVPDFGPHDDVATICATITDEMAEKLFLAAIRAIEASGAKIIGREPTEGMTAALYANMEHVEPQLAILKAFRAAYDAAPTFSQESVE